MKKLLSVCILLASLASFAGCSSGRVVAQAPSERVVITARPGPGYVWRNNRWIYGGNRFFRPAPVIVAPYGHPYAYRGRSRFGWNRF